jgi:hypothetical protein
MFERVYQDSLEGAIRRKGALAVLRDLTTKLCVVRHDTDAETCWAYSGLVVELQALIVRTEMADRQVNLYQERGNVRSA